MESTGWQRFIPLTGIAFVALFVVGVLVMDLPMSDASDGAITEFYADSNNRAMVCIGAFLFALGGIALLLFANRVRSVILDAEGGRPSIATATFAGGIVLATTVFGGASAFAAIPVSMELGDAPAPSAEVARWIQAFGATLVMFSGALAASLMILTTAIASFRFGIFAAWFNWLSVVCGIVVIFSVFWIPLIALGVWMVAAAVLLFQRKSSSTPAPAAQAPVASAT